MSTGTPLLGCRSAFAVTAFPTIHADDIAGSALRHHTPLPGAVGGYARSDGTDWQRVSEIPLADIASYAQGSIIYGAGADWGALAVGGANAFLTTDGTDVAWSTGLLSITAAKTLTVSNSLTLAGTDGKALTLTDSLTVEGGNAGTLHFDAAATVTVSASCTINNWFDQSVKQAASPTFADVFLPDGGTVGIDGNELLTFNTAGTAVFSGCDIGINVAPVHRLAVDGGAIATGATLYVHRNLASASTDPTVAYIQQEHAGDDQAALYIDQAGSGAALRVNTGDVQIGTAPAAGHLVSIDGDGTTVGTCLLVDRNLAAASTDSAVTTFRQLHASDDQDTLYLSQAGTGHALYVAVGTVRIQDLGGSGNDDLYVDNDGKLINNPSDARFKSNVRAIGTDALAAICGLRGVFYDWNDAVREVGDMGARRQVGLIAQEVEPFIPLAVTDSPRGYKTVSAKKIIPYLVEAIKAQQLQIDNL